MPVEIWIAVPAVVLALIVGIAAVIVIKGGRRRCVECGAQVADRNATRCPACESRFSARSAGAPVAEQPKPATTDFELVTTEGPLASRRFPVSARGLTIGRNPDNDIVLAGEFTVSRHHAVITMEQGQYVLNVVPPSEVKKDQFAPRITIAMEGLPIGSLNKSNFLATLDPHLKSILPNHKLLSTKEIYFSGMGLLPMSRSRWSEPTKKTVVRTYSGQDPYGRELKIRAYTAGGMTMACNIILVADAKSYEQTLSVVEEVLNLVRIRLRSPSIRFPG